MQERKHAVAESSDSEGSEVESTSDELESDEVEALLRQEQLRQQYRQRIAAMKDHQYTAAFLRRFVEHEALRSSVVTGLNVLVWLPSDTHLLLSLGSPTTAVQCSISICPAPFTSRHA